MGGGGGGSYDEADLDQLKRKLRESEAQTENTKYEAEVANLLMELLAEVNGRDTEAVNRHLDEIQRALEKELDGMVNLVFGGSVAKHTHIDGLSDVDSLVVLDNCQLADGSPDTAKEYFVKRLKERLPQTEVTSGTLAVTVRFSDAEIQLLPAISCENHVKIADASGTKWVEIKPKEFTKVLTQTNERLGKQVVPVVKLAKAIIGTLPDKHRISGYHAESLAVEVFTNYEGKQNLKAMLKHYFEKASDLVRQPIPDRTGQSVHVDDYLGNANSLERRIVSDAFGRVTRRISKADSAGSIDEWRELFDE